MDFVGVVDHVSDDGRFAFLRMQWEDNPPPPPVLTPTFAYVTQTKTVGVPLALPLAEPVVCLTA
ncbi:hypothetical protein OCO_15650 [Mycobacterium intracellulare MOTT-02]|nr:hypothetical protein OCO_15650 [Mycobacterium intracellulare MOTT-02]